MQILSAAAVSISFLVVGTIASAKIGGGSNLHNLDMFLMSLVIIAFAFVNFIIKHNTDLAKNNFLLALSIAVTLISPVTHALQNNERLELPKKEKTDESLAAVQNKVRQYAEQGEILFIDHRQLLTFGLVKNIPLVNEYEKKYLMDQAMAAKDDYFHDFYEDISNQRFALIVNEPTNIISRGSEYSFGEENDAYVKWVTKPLLCWYEPIYTSQATALELLVPRTETAPDYFKCEDIFPEINDK